MALWTAFLLGFVGSLHCAGMCGPLALALPVVGRTRAAFILSRITYNLGRLVTYGALGLVFGLLGETLALAGLQSWLSLAAGAALLMGLLTSSRHAVGTPAVKFVVWVKAGLGQLLQRRSFTALFTLGLLNGLLPCGLVYVACASATATGSLLTATEYMLGFGAGTLPMMLGIGLARRPLQALLRFPMQRLITASLLMVALLLILRGLALGIPYVSPDLLGAAPCCRP
jgi:sulfite exporter TauE/SafE